MKKTFIHLFVVAIFSFISCQNKPTSPPDLEKKENTMVKFVTADSVEIFGDLHVLDKKTPIVLLFHQAGSNGTGEYQTIIPKLKNAGFNVMAIDQRVGGQRFGKYNRTIVDFTKNEFTYCDAYPDLEAALNFVLANEFTGKKIIWGSSYSASLVIQLAHKRSEDVAGALAFSPASGGPMEACRPYEYFADLKTPLLLLRPASEMERESVRAQYELAKENGHQVYVAENGVHGSSMLVEERTEASVEATWKVVMNFLKKFH